MKVIYNVISKHCFIIVRTLRNQEFFQLQGYQGLTGISTVNIGGTTIHSGLAIKPGTKLLGLNNKSKAVLINRLSEVKVLIIDELSMVSSGLWTDIDSRLGEIFMMIPEKAFVGLSVMTVADLLQLLQS